MPDFEHDRDIRDLLVHSPAPQLTYDLDATLADGHRVRTRRRFAAAGGALAAAAAIAIAYGAVADLPGREVLPAGQQQEQKSEEKVAEILGDRYAVGVKPAASGTGVTVTTYSVSEGKRTEIESWTTDG